MVTPYYPLKHRGQNGIILPHDVVGSDDLVMALSQKRMYVRTNMNMRGMVSTTFQQAGCCVGAPPCWELSMSFVPTSTDNKVFKVRTRLSNVTLVATIRYMLHHLVHRCLLQDGSEDSRLSVSNSRRRFSRFFLDSRL
jgi:hypothetical protein